MKKLKKIAVVGAIVLALGATSITAFAATGPNTPAGIVAGLTGKSVESVTAQKVETGKTYGSLASDYGVLTQFKTQMLEQKKTQLAERVKAGTMTQERADEIIAAMEANQANCDGSCSGGTGSKMGAGFGTGTGKGNGTGSMSRNHGGGQNGSNCGSGYCIGNAQN